MTAAKPVTAIMIGAGDRGKDIYGRYALDHPNDIRFLAVAEPNDYRRQAFALQHGLEPERVFSSWEPLLAQPKAADAAFVCTQDQMHSKPALAAMEQGYHIMLEKPMAPTAEECRLLVHTAESRGLHLQIGYVMRYSAFYNLIHQVIHSGQLGELICLSQRENVSYWHMSHSFVRGNWRSSQESTPMILAKCCHDMDLLRWLVGSPVHSISSTGNLKHFRSDKAPQGAPEHCADGCPHEQECIFSAVDIYVRLTPLLRLGAMSGAPHLNLASKFLINYPGQAESLAKIIPPLRQFTEWKGWPVRVMTTDYTRQGRMRAIQDPSNPYGRCVYHCDNDVVDHQHTNIEFTNGVTATLIMHGHSYAEGRTLRIDGSKATLTGELYYHRQRLTLFDKRSGRETVLYKGGLTLDEDGHGGGDDGLMEAFVKLMRGQEGGADTDAQASLESHLMAFAAEQSRLESRTILMDQS
jgi:predicted dehydrogenase